MDLYLILPYLFHGIGGWPSDAVKLGLGMVEKCLDEYGSVKRKILDKVEDICAKNHAPMALSVLYTYSMHIVSHIMGPQFVKDMKALLVSDIEKLDKVYGIWELSDRSFLLLHSLQDKEKFTRDMSSIFLNFRKHSLVANSTVAISYKCGTSSVTDQGVYHAYNQASIAFLEALTQDHYKHMFIEDMASKIDEFGNDMKLASYFQDAISEKRLSLAFQPVINAKNGKISGHESLLRLVTHEGAIISAGPFIPIAEKMGFIDAVDEMVLDMVASELYQSSSVFLGMNVSSASIDNNNWLNKAKLLLKDPDVASRLVIEITETSAQRDLKKLGYFVDFVQGLGAQIAIDDFGAGYTSFKQLQHLRADIIKIDGLFIKDIVTNHDNRFFVQMMLDCSKTFNMKTVAEFVENGEIAKVLMGLDVDYMQGNYFGPAVNYRSWIKDDCKK